MNYGVGEHEEISLVVNYNRLLRTIFTSELSLALENSLNYLLIYKISIQELLSDRCSSLISRKYQNLKKIFFSHNETRIQPCECQQRTVFQKFAVFEKSKEHL